MKIQTIIFLVLLSVSYGCANPINLYTAKQYDIAAYDSIERGEWKQARMYYSRAWGNAQMGGADIRDISRLRYEYGRASGVVCEWEEAETALNEAYEMDIKSNGPYWMPVVELERMFIAKKDFQKANTYFEKLMPILNEVGAETGDPLAYADVLDEYALVLEKIGKPEEANKHLKRAKQLKDTFPGRESRTEITPYGTQCN